MALIAMAVYDTEENGRTALTRRTLISISETVDFNRHRLIVVDNASIPATREMYADFQFIEQVIDLDINIGTAAAINQAWKTRKPGEHAVKMDNDVEFRQNGFNWCDQLEDAINRDPRIGICGLKRKDCWETPWHESEFYRSTVYMLPHNPGERWIIGEEVSHVMGTCQMYSSALLDKIGYLLQPRLYGFDDVIASARSTKAGFLNVFLSHIEIDHIDPGDTPYQAWKQQHAGEDMAVAMPFVDKIMSGEQSVYYNPYQ